MPSWLFPGAVLPLLLVGLLIALVVEHIVVYLRDGYRASYFATPDLVDFIRDLDDVLRNEGITASGSRVKISFLAHSLGCSITANTLRVLSNVFAKGSKDISETLVLDRLVLVAPDIPVESVIPRRSNVLVSALRREEEVHVFTNEGDLALRLASTAANYFSFPARSRFSGYRLGNLTLKHFRNARDRKGRHPRYGVVPRAPGEVILPSRFLEIRASSAEHRHLWEKPFFPWIATGTEDVTNKISYYDCTDYIDVLDCSEPVDDAAPYRFWWYRLAGDQSPGSEPPRVWVSAFGLPVRTLPWRGRYAWGLFPWPHQQGMDLYPRLRGLCRPAGEPGHAIRRGGQ